MKTSWSSPYRESRQPRSCADGSRVVSQSRAWYPVRATCRMEVGRHEFALGVDHPLDWNARLCRVAHVAKATEKAPWRNASRSECSAGSSTDESLRDVYGSSMTREKLGHSRIRCQRGERRPGCASIDPRIYVNEAAPVREIGDALGLEQRQHGGCTQSQAGDQRRNVRAHAQ